MFSFDQDFVSRRTRDSTIIREETIIKIRYRWYVHGKAVAVTQKGSVCDALQSAAFLLAITWHLLFTAPDILRGLKKYVIKTTHQPVSSDSRNRTKGDSVVCHWASKSEAKLVWELSGRWDLQGLGKWSVRDKQMNRLGFESSAFWVRWADPVLVPRKKSDKESHIIQVRCVVEWVHMLLNNSREVLPLLHKKKGGSLQRQWPTSSAHKPTEKCQSSPSIGNFRFYF